jgi:hypothetical protein
LCVEKPTSSLYRQTQVKPEVVRTIKWGSIAWLVIKIVLELYDLQNSKT